MSTPATTSHLGPLGSTIHVLRADAATIAELAAVDWSRHFGRVSLDPARGLITLMSPSRLHDDLSVILEDIVDLAAEEFGWTSKGLRSTRLRPRGDPPGTGMEPDCAFYVGERAERYRLALMEGNAAADAFVDELGPDLVVEVEVTHVDKGKIERYGALGAQETRGARPKYWVRIGEDSERWLLKIPRPRTGEHWAEKVTAEIGHLIGVDCAHVELAQYAAHAVLAAGNGERRDDEQGREERPEYLATICKSFVPDERDGDRSILSAYHGVEVLQFVVDGYDTERRFRQKEHNIRNIAAGMAKLMSVNSREPMPR